MHKVTKEIINPLFGGVSTSGHTNNSSTAASGLGVLTSDTVAPVVTNTTVSSNLLQSLNILTNLANQGVHHDLGGLSGHLILLSVNEPRRNFKLLGVGDDSNELFDLFVGESAGTTLDVDFGLLAAQVGETLANTSDLSDSKHNLALTVNVGVQHTKNVLKLLGHKETLQTMLFQHKK